MEGIRGPGFPWDCPEIVSELVVSQSDWWKSENRKKKVDSQDENQMAKEQSRIEEESLSNWNKILCAQRPSQNAGKHRSMASAGLSFIWGSSAFQHPVEIPEYALPRFWQGGLWSRDQAKYN